MAQYSYEDFIKRTNSQKSSDGFGKSKIPLPIISCISFVPLFDINSFSNHTVLGV